MLYQTKKFLHSKGNNERNQMTAYRMGGNTNHTSDKGLIFKMYKKLIHFHSKTKQNKK